MDLLNLLSNKSYFHKTNSISYCITGGYMNCLNNLNGCELVTLANTIAISISQNLSSEETALLGGFFTIIGDSLSTLSLTKNCNNTTQKNN